MIHNRLKGLGEELNKRLGSSSPPDKELVGMLESVFSDLRRMDVDEAADFFNQILVQLPRGGDHGQFVELALEPLNHAYQAYRGAGRGRTKDIVKWLATTKSGSVSDFFKLATGLDLESLQKVYKLSRNRIIDVANISRNPGYESFYDDVFEILGPLDKHLAYLLDFRPKDLKILEKFRQTGKLPETMLWRYKGRITELLADPMKEAVLKRLVDEEGFKNAKRFEGLRANTALTKAGDKSDGSGFLEIWDGIVAEHKQGGLKIFDIFEIKSGRYGHDTGLDQVLATYNTRFSTPGDTLKVPMGDGISEIFKRAPGKTGAGLIDDTAARYHIIAPQGLSNVLPEQRILLESNKTIDVLTMTLNDRPVHHRDIEALVLDLLLTRGR